MTNSIPSMQSRIDVEGVLEMTQTTKITVKVYESLFVNFSKQIDELHIKKDAFLNSMIREEIPHLAREMKGKRLSNAANRYISGELKRLGTRTVNIVVDKSTASALNAIVDESNMVRDAFINRLIMLLRSSPTLLKFFDLPEFITGSEFESYIDPLPTSPLTAIKAIHNDPMFYLREAAGERFDSGLYLLPMPEKFAGFSCYLDDMFVPGTEGNAELIKESQELLDALDLSEAEAFKKPTK